jgi:hypothetical protein
MTEAEHAERRAILERMRALLNSDRGGLGVQAEYFALAKKLEELEAERNR